MTGTYEHSIDSAGRLIVPAKLREELGSTFYLAVGVKENLTLYPMAAWNKLQERVTNLTTAQAASMDVFFASGPAVRGGQAMEISGAWLSEGLCQD